MTIDMSIDIVAPQMSIVKRCLHLNRHVVEQNNSTLKIYHYQNKNQPGFFNVYPTLNVHTAVCQSTLFVENWQNVDRQKNIVRNMSTRCLDWSRNMSVDSVDQHIVGSVDAP